MFQNNLGTALERTGHFAAAGKAYEAVLAADSTYGKAAASLERVTPHVASDTSTVDLAAVAGSSARRCGRGGIRPRRGTPTAVDSAVVPSDSRRRVTRR